MSSSLGQTVKVTIQDGRQIEGTLLCFDKDMSLVIEGATETQPLPELDVQLCKQTVQESWQPGSGDLYLDTIEQLSCGDDIIPTSSSTTSTPKTELKKRLGNTIIPGQYIEKVELRQDDTLE
eukprot:TRINITY_DN3897_c0_g2_i2.p1 TRINITY_DN3897_c0_g2~~TRINITY_DN3897_c0_g2_i2.p1  ORF type:complete len:122 (+),score=20.45 TRINITY_DN3897_c0_g2_i2:67-432(+)